MFVRLLFTRYTCACFVLGFAISYYLLDHQIKSKHVIDKSKLVVGILSARNNFQLRETIRSSWLSAGSLLKFNVTPSSYKAFFIIGKRPCAIPPICRLDKFGCNKWNVDFSKVETEFVTAKETTLEKSENDTESSQKTFYQGFSFHVNHPVVLTKLGVFSKLLSDKYNVNVTLMELQTKEPVVKTTISYNVSGVTIGDFIYNNVDNFMLPKNFKGLLLVEGLLRSSHDEDMKWNNNSGVLTFEKVYSSSSDVESFPFSDEVYVAPSVGLTVLDLDTLNQTSSFCRKRLLKYGLELQKVNTDLMAEHKVHGDIVFVDVVDTYRNLPQKLLLFYKWLSSNFKFDFLLKTDDDSVIDIPKILQVLQDPLYSAEKLWVWSRFRFGWPVNYVGKWADNDYRSPVYPTFPCGAAYVMSRKTVNWLQKNIDHLFPYQGEDVSLGIWLASVNPKYIEDKRWVCNETCTKQSLNIGQLNEQSVVNAWSNKFQCGNICSC